MLDLSLITVTYREDPEVLRRAFASVAGSQGITSELIVIDNAGRDDTAQLLGQIVPGSTYLKNQTNRGFAAAVNQGLRQAKGRYLLLLNPDTEFAPHVLAKMISHLDQDREVGIASCRLKYPAGEPQESIRRFPTLLNQITVLFKLPHLFPRTVSHYMMRDANAEKTQDVDSIMGAFMFIRRSLIEQIGLFDERYFIWFEEVDYCKMARQRGWKIRHYGDIGIVHHKGHVFNKLGTVRKQRWLRESLRKYMKKHHGVWPWLVLWSLTPLLVALGYIAAGLKRR